MNWNIVYIDINRQVELNTKNKEKNRDGKKEVKGRVIKKKDDLKKM